MHDHTAGMFKNYPSIVNKDVRGHDSLESGIVWLATHKYHGTNGLVILLKDSDELVFGRKKGLPKDDESHYGFREAATSAGDWSKLLCLEDRS